MNNDTLPTLQQPLSVTCQAEIARRIERPRGFVHRLANGQPLYDFTVIEALAAALHQPVEYVTKIVKADRARRRNEATVA